MSNVLERFITIYEAKVIKCSITEFQLYGRIPDVHADWLRNIAQDVEMRIRQRYDGNMTEELNKKISELSLITSRTIKKMVNGTLKSEDETGLSVLVKQMGIMMECKM